MQKNEIGNFLIAGFTNATANVPTDRRKPPFGGLPPSSSLQLDRPKDLPLHSSLNALPRSTPPNSFSYEDEKKSSGGKKSGAGGKNPPLRNLYVGNPTNTMSMDCPTIYVSKSSDGESPPPTAYAVKRHSSTGDALEMCRQNPDFQRRLQQAQNSQNTFSTVTLTPKEKGPITDF